MSERMGRGRGERPADAPPIKHGGVTDSNGRLPALLLAWCRVDGDTEGRVVPA